ncbi:Asp-tRNA(Asn)/Glu-tRNA(Gln) amidotransferase subunit GatB [archaeon]|nr:Asp-tRNA(Asn)/Glu-tRNA(Gln) amidotransferase subunit GatB [archaeon]
MSDETTIMIGLETHVQLNSNTKIFCGCPNPVVYTANLKNKELEPNTLTCPTCLGLPGSKPRTNAKVVELATKTSLAVGCKIADATYFSRKTYFYPDMSKNFQTTQFEVPLAEKGEVELNVDELKKKIRIRRIHMEEDPAKIIHEKDYTLVDYNRSGIPLIEIVTEPDMKTPKEARLYLQKLAMILEYLGVYDSTSEAALKTDANISINGGNRVEIKNITGTKEIERALSYEFIRQKNAVKRGVVIVQETRQWDPTTGITKALRTKESEADYGYIFEPDLNVIDVDKKLTERLKKEIPELPDDKEKRFIKAYKLTQKMAESLVAEKDIADLFEIASKNVSVANAATWCGIVLKKTLNYNNLTFVQSGLKQEWMIELILSYEKKEYSDVIAEKILRKMVDDKCDSKTVAKKYKFQKLGDVGDVDSIVKKLIGANKKAVDDYKAGSEKSLNFLVGQVMRETKGGVDANTARKKILEMLK